MRKTHKVRTFSKGNFGISQNLILLTCFILFLLALAFGAINNSVSGHRFEMLRDANIELSAETKRNLTLLAQLPKKNIELEGNYNYLIDYGQGKILQGNVAIDRKSFSRSVGIKHYSMFGEAEYKIVGSTVQYTDVSGDRYLFPKEGTAIGVDDQFGNYLEIDGDFRLYIETQYSEGDYEPLVKTNSLSLWHKLKQMTLWSVLQIISAVVGLIILSYVLLRVIIDTRNTSRRDLLKA